MKHLKKYEDKELNKMTNGKLLPQYNGLVFIVIPSEKYFRSNIRFSLVFINEVIEFKGENENVFYDIISRAVFQRSEYYDRDHYDYTSWSKNYNEHEFNNCDFMTIQEFYNKYTENYIQILNISLDKIKENPDNEIVNTVLDKISIPEVEHIIRARDFNI